MRESEQERRRRFDPLFASYSSDIVAYCGWRAGAGLGDGWVELGDRGASTPVAGRLPTTPHRRA
jgi:hypothetical protein